MTYTKIQEPKTVMAERLVCDDCGQTVTQSQLSTHEMMHERITPEKHGYRYVTKEDLFEYKSGPRGWVRCAAEVLPDSYRSSIITEQMGIRRQETIVFNGEGWYGSFEVTADDGDTDYEWHHVSKIAKRMYEEWHELANQIAIINALGGKP